MPEEIVQETGSSTLSDSKPLANNLTPAQRQFAEVLGNCLVGHWRRMHTEPQKVSGHSRHVGNANHNADG
jgi:hypothetical protein